VTERSLQVTYRNGKAFAAYLHLLHQTGEKSVKTVPSADGLLVVDYAQDGKPIGVEITAPSAVPLDRVNRLLADLGETPRASNLWVQSSLNQKSEPLVMPQGDGASRRADGPPTTERSDVLPER